MDGRTYDVERSGVARANVTASPPYLGSSAPACYCSKRADWRTDGLACAVRLDRTTDAAGMMHWSLVGVARWPVRRTKRMVIERRRTLCRRRRRRRVLGRPSSVLQWPVRPSSFQAPRIHCCNYYNNSHHYNNNNYCYNQCRLWSVVVPNSKNLLLQLQLQRQQPPLPLLLQLILLQLLTLPQPIPSCVRPVDVVAEMKGPDTQQQDELWSYTAVSAQSVRRCSVSVVVVVDVIVVVVSLSSLFSGRADNATPPLDRAV